MAKQQTTSKAMVLDATQALAKIQGSASDPERVNNRLALAADRFNLLSPATNVGQLPEATAVALSAVFVDSRLTKDGGDCWAMGGGMLMPAKHKVMQIGGALGITWDPDRCGRVDDGSDPHYCKWKVVGRYRRFDGTWTTIPAHKQMDLRDGSDLIVKLRKDAAARDRSADNQITELRSFIEEHAETKAMLRLIRAAAGMKTSYTRGELNKPFVAASLQITGQTDDPVLKRMFMEEMLHGGNRTFGPAPAAPPPAALPAAQAPIQVTLEAPPPVGSVPLDEDDTIPQAEPEPPPPRQQSRHVVRRPQPKAAPAPPPEPAPEPTPAPPVNDDRPLVCPWGDHEGKQWHELPDEALIHFYNKFADQLDQDRAKNPERHRAHLAIMAGALEARGLVAPDEEPPPPEDPDEY
jgi:hypothetical protein